MKRILIGLLVLVAMIWLATHFKACEPASKSSSSVGYSQSCWQEGNVLHVVTAKGDTVRLDVSRLEEE